MSIKKIVIIDYKMIVSKMEAYRVIMSKPFLRGDNGQLIPDYRNPLYV